MAKNSNYKNDPTRHAKNDSEARDRRKNRIITIVCASLLALFVVSVTLGVVIAGQPKPLGKIVIKIDCGEAPKTVENFMKLVNDGFYDGLTVFRAQENFVIQGGENKEADLTPIVGEFSENGYTNNIIHNRGVISMARTNDPNSATSQFFITLHDSAKYSLDGKYAGFGYVIEGMDVVDEIAELLIGAPSSGYMGFVDDADAVKIVYAKELSDYNDAEDGFRYVEMEFARSDK